MTIHYFVDGSQTSSQQLKGIANNSLTNADKTSVKNSVNEIIRNHPANYFTSIDINGKSDSSQINNPEVSSWKYGDGTIDVHVDRPLGYFNDDGQWVDLNPQMKLTDVFPDTHLAKGRDAAIKPRKFWLIENSDNRKNFGNDSCKFDTMVVTAFNPGSWGLLNHKYYVNNPDSLSDDGPLNIMSSVRKADK